MLAPMVDESETAPAAEKERAVSGAKPTLPEYPSEAELDSPNRNTLVLLFVVFFVTFCSWGAARFACNMHPPESRGAPKLATEKLITTAKDAAIEFVQRWRSGDYDGAAEVSTAELATEMTAARAECQKTANVCARKREAEAGRLTTAIVRRSDGFYAESDVTTTLKDKTEKYRVNVQRQGALWKAVSKSAL
jgi:hypothetical protein